MKNALYFLGGALIGFGTAYVSLEDRMGRKYAEMANANKRAYEMARGMNPEEVAVEPDEEDTPVPIDIMPKIPTFNPVPTNGNAPVAPADGAEKQPTVNPYHTAVAAVDTPADIFAQGTVMDNGISYIEDEEYESEDGHEKFHVDVIMNDDAPIFLLDGVPIEDWNELLGESILIDMFTKCPPGIPAILYVRNHKLLHDYEVVRVEP